MPELPEVETVVRGLQTCVGQSLRELALYDPKVWFESELAPEAFAGKTLQALKRRGKYLVYDFGDAFLLQHLRMTGKVLPKESSAIPKGLFHDPAKNRQIRCEFVFPGQNLYFYDTRRFGTLTAVTNLKEFWREKGIAPDPIEAPEAALRHFSEVLQTSSRPLKAALLDQSILAGTGNIYADEALHSRRLHPLLPAKKVRGPRPLFETIRALFLSAIEARGTSVYNYVDASGERGGFAAKLKVYGREGQPCLSCAKRKIQRIVVGGRSTHFCPHCQGRR